MRNKMFPEKMGRRGSALILAVVLTSLLVIIGAVFMMMAKVDNTATSDISTSRELNNAAESIISELSQQLVKDVPGIDNNEFYDYPGDKDMWLASNEPNVDASGNYRWGQISDVNGFLRNFKVSGISIATQGVRIDPAGSSVYIKDYPEINLNLGNLAEGSKTDGYGNKQYRGQPADADGDGILDSKWIQLDKVTSGKGEKIYAAVRVIDNGGMININTGGQLIPFGPNIKANTVDGHSQTQVNLANMAATSNDTINKIIDSRVNGQGADGYENRVFWHYNNNDVNYVPFDMSDELELRNRYCIVSKAENRFKGLWHDTIGKYQSWPFDGTYDSTSPSPNYYRRFDDWIAKIFDGTNAYYDRRHFLTTYNMDRVIDPSGRQVKVNNQNIRQPSKQVNIQDVNDAQKLYNDIYRECYGANCSQAQLAQVVANIKDYGDNENPPKVTVINDKYDPVTKTYIGEDHYGDEAPHLCLSEIVCKSYEKDNSGFPPTMYYTYAIEVYKPFDAPGENKFDDWQLNISGYKTIKLTDGDFTKSGGRLFVVVFQDTNDPNRLDVKFTDSPGNGAINVDPCAVLEWGDIAVQEPNGTWRDASSYCLYFGTDLDAVTDANIHNDRGMFALYVDKKITSYNPWTITKGMNPYESRKYYWRVDAFYDPNGATPADLRDDINEIGDVLSYTTHSDPNGPDPCEILHPINFKADTVVTLERNVNGNFITVDKVADPNLGTWLRPAKGNHIRSYERDTHEWGRLKRIWQQRDGASPGKTNGWNSGVERIQSLRHRFHNVGEVGNVFKKSTYMVLSNQIVRNDTEQKLRMDLMDPNVQKIFKYITVIDPNDHIKDPNETRVKGRININTAPWFVIAQLPWISVKASEPVSGHYELARAIVAYRDKQKLSGGPDYATYKRQEVISAIKADPDPMQSKRINANLNLSFLREEKGFESIGELTTVLCLDKNFSMDYYATDNKDQQGYPDLTFNKRQKSTDGVADDYEERNLIFSRLSDLVTVRSDVFTAYILVRIGVNGPQQRYMAILDRSGVKQLSDPVKIVSFSKVPDPR